MKKKLSLLAVPLFFALLLAKDAFIPGVNPYNIPKPLGWLQDPQVAQQSMHCSSPK